MCARRYKPETGMLGGALPQPGGGSEPAAPAVGAAPRGPPSSRLASSSTALSTACRGPRMRTQFSSLDTTMVAPDSACSDLIVLPPRPMMRGTCLARMGRSCTPPCSASRPSSKRTAVETASCFP
eukprot:scaffold5212_cov108-Isochrysis_galbana.AAC.6